MGSSEGAWRLPDDSVVDTTVSSDFYLVRSNNSLQLNRMSSATGPTGIFTCSIVGVSQPQYIGIYANENEGEFDFL